jgi:hypothetical protein
VLHGKTQRALPALTDRYRNAECARDSKRLVDEMRIVWDGAYDEVYIDGIGRRAQMRGGGSVVPGPAEVKGLCGRGGGTDIGRLRKGDEER